MDQDELLPGLVLRARGGFYEIETSQGLITSSLRGRFKQNRSSGELVAVGDRVKLRRLPDGGAVIEQIEERTRTLSRRSPGRGQEQVIVANPDQAVFVLSCADPEPNFRMLDRLLVVAEREALPAMICANKLDLVEPRSARAAFGVYQQIGYPVLYTSALKGKGVSELRQRLRGKLSVFAGPSGAGKSSLLNRVQPGMALRTAEISQATGKGTHTTVVRELLPLKGGGYLADTPGLKAFALWDIEPDELDGYFREMAPLVRQCDFSDCTHTHEPGCAVRAAVERGEIDPERYDSYLRMRAGDTD
ncbi:MAG TPA: ribosome small subunit-dependent GTPase A [Anaerolineales bacterium]|nr:ribosome small subunit-dependent GTPase A [Anaerolineales bacterium]